MTFTPTYDAIKSDCKKKIGSGQVVVEAKLKAEGTAAIAKVLSITADSDVTDFEALSGAASYSGRVAFKVMYIAEDGSCNCLDYNADFDGKLDGEGISPTARLFLTSNVVDTDTVSIGADSIKLSSVVDVTAYLLQSEELTCLVCNSPDIYTQFEKIDYLSLVTVVKQDFMTENEFALSDICGDILLIENAVALSDAKARLDSIALSGRIVTNVVYKATDNKLKNCIFITEFMQELPAAGTTADARVDASVKLGKWQSKLIVGEGEGAKTLLKMEYQIDAFAFVYSMCKKDVIVDAFCVTNDIQIVAESCKLTSLEQIIRVDSNIDGNANLEEGMPAIDSVLGVCAARINVANSYADEGKVTVEGLLNTSVIYHNGEFDTTNSVAVELPYSLTLSAQGVTSANTVTVEACITSVSAKAKRGSAVEITAGVALEVKVYKTMDAYCVKDIVVGGEKMLDLNAISIYIAKANQTLWDVAKALSTTPELLMTQNPALNSPLKGGERVTIYRQLD